MIGDRIRVLIADDRDLIRRGIRELLFQNPSVEVCGEAQTGTEAVRKCAEIQPDDVALLDFNIPTLNGLEAAREIKKLSPQAEILMVTIERSEETSSPATATYGI